MSSKIQSSSNFTNQPMPVSLAIPGGMVGKHVICITGAPTTECKRFTINLLNESSGDIAFQFEVCFNHMGNRDVVVQRTMSCRDVVKEEKVSQFPFSAGTSAKVSIHPEATGYQVKVDDVNYCFYKYAECGPGNPDTVNIRHHLDLHKVEFELIK